MNDDIKNIFPRLESLFKSLTPEGQRLFSNHVNLYYIKFLRGRDELLLPEQTLEDDYRAWSRWMIRKYEIVAECTETEAQCAREKTKASP